MADSALTKTVPMINTLPDFTSDTYANIAPDELVVFAVYTLQDDGHYSAMEEIVSACFRLFPHRFSLKNYFYWPDSATTLSFLNEAKNKGDLKGNQTEGFAVKVQGRQTVKRVAKALGVTLPAPEKKVKPAPTPEIKPTQPEIEKKAEIQEEITPIQPALNEAPTKKKPARKPKENKPTKPVAKKAAKKKRVVASKEKKPAIKSAKPAKKKVVVSQPDKPVAKKKAPAKKKPVRKTAPVKTKALLKPAPIKQETLRQVKVEEPKQTKKKKELVKPAAPVTVQKTPAQKKEKPQAQPAQLTMSLMPVAEEKKAKPVPPVVKKVESKPVKVEMVIAPVAVLQVSKEEKVKAGRFVQSMERSDAYRQYKKSGDKSRISEFDFRSLLLCTMESSPETLARNMNTFKGYATIQNRQDLVVFLNFMESSFSTLLNSSGKKLAKKK